jgi:hypothetical protein
MVDLEHPKQRLRFSATGSWPTTAEVHARARVALLQQMEWTLGPPTVDWGVGSMEGGVQIHSALPPWGEALPIDVDEAELRQTLVLAKALIDISLDLKAVVHLHLDDAYIGEIRHGVPDQSVAIGLLEEWQRGLAERKRTRSG